ncbi:hypothetical protein M1N79_03665 [Dehalococcoidia bacterium]|nr:hypothetical protein [Dehalococcoidia bacterium]
MANYWVVGASWGGVEHQDKKFVDEGYWMLGWEKKINQANMHSKANEAQGQNRNQKDER